MLRTDHENTNSYASRFCGKSQEFLHLHFLAFSIMENAFFVIMHFFERSEDDDGKILSVNI